MNTILERELSRPPRDNTWIEYHKEMTEKYRYFVDTDDLSPFYTNESLDDIKRLGSALIDVVNNEWTSDEWNTTPYKYRFAGGSIYEWFAQPNTVAANHITYGQAGLKKDGQFIELNYRNANESLNLYVEEGHIIAVLRGGNYTRNSKGSWTRTIGNKSLDIDFPITDFRPSFDRMNAKRWRGFFAPILLDVIENEGLQGVYVIE